MAGEKAGTVLGCALIDEQRLHGGGFHTAHVHSDNLRAHRFIEGQEYEYEYEVIESKESKTSGPREPESYY